MVNLGAFNLWRPKPLEGAVAIDLRSIEMQLLTHGQFSLFKERIAKQIHNGRKKQVQPIVAKVAADLMEIGHVLLEDSATHTRRAAQVEALTIGSRQLEALGSAWDPHNQSEEQAAINRDTATFQKYVGLVIKPTRREVLVYDMTHPANPPLKVLSDFSICREVRNYLRTKYEAGHPDLWERRQLCQKLTPNGFRWSYLKLSDKIYGKHLEYVDRADPRAPYIVVLKYENDETETPQPIDIAPIGDPCCHEQCMNLQAHLQSIWPQQIVARALKIEDGVDVLSETFNAGLFDPNTDGLLVYLEPR